MRFTTTAVSRRSPRYFGKILPRLGSPTWWPARPMRCSPRATEPGDSTWIDEIDRTHVDPELERRSSRRDSASRPDLRSSSIISRCSRESEPWCAFAIWLVFGEFVQSRRETLGHPARVDEHDRRVVLRARARGSRDGSPARSTYVCRIPSPSAGSMSSSAAMSSTGTTTSMSSSFSPPASMIVTSRGT